MYMKKPVIVSYEVFYFTPEKVEKCLQHVTEQIDVGSISEIYGTVRYNVKENFSLGDKETDKTIHFYITNYISKV